MAASSFDPTHAVQFDLPHGSVRAGKGTDPVLLVPCSALDELVLSLPAEAVETLGRALGASIGRRAAARLDNVQSATLEAFVTQLAGEAALAGIGLLSVERWGRALVVVVEKSTLVGTLLVPLVASAVESAFERTVWCTLLSRDESAARVLVASEAAVGRVRNWIAAGTPWGEALVNLQGGQP